MPFWYTVVQYVPGPVAGERVNLEIIAWGSGEVVCAFVDDVARARARHLSWPTQFWTCWRGVRGAAEREPARPLYRLMLLCRR